MLQSAGLRPDSQGENDEKTHLSSNRLSAWRDGNGRAGEVVRQFFTVTDAARFATAGGDAAELLALEPELERVLQQLEERL